VTERVASHLPLRVVVADDEAPARALLKSHVARRPDLRLVDEVCSGSTVVAAIERLSPDLVLLDIEMPDLNGFDALAELRARGRSLPHVIFVTAFDRYAVRAFDVNAVDYLLKPVSRARFDQAVDRARHVLATIARLHAPARQLLEDLWSLPPTRILVRDRGRIVPVSIKSIEWLEAEGDYVRVHTNGRTHLVERTISDFERILTPLGFARIHRSTIVNLDVVRELRAEGSARYQVVLKDGQTLVASRSYSPRFRKDVV
jgi:two-component system LytT family response regulator